MKKKKIVRVLLLLLVIVGSLAFLQRLLMPKYMTGVVEGALVGEYYQAEKDHDVIMIGDCEVYENLSPIKLWEDYGITSYIRGSAQQLIWQSYYLLEDTLKYEKPKVVVFNVLSMKYNEPQKEAYNRMTLDGMKWSPSKVRAVKASMTEDEEFLDYVFPILRYHSRWSDLSRDDFTYLFHRDQVSHNGYYMRVDVKPAGTFPREKRLANYQFGDQAYRYLDMMTELCKENGIHLVLIKAPSLYPAWYDEWDQQMEEYAKAHDLQYINFLEETRAAGLDFTEDTYDGGLHLNLAGAEKLSAYFGKILQDTYELEDHRNDPDLKALWEQKKTFYQNMKADQENELNTYGYLTRFSVDQ